MALLRNLLLDDDAATAVEYAVMLALIIVVCAGAIRTVGQTASETWGNDADKIGGALTGS